MSEKNVELSDPTEPVDNELKDKATSRILKAGWAASISAVVTGLLGIAGFFVSDAEGKLAWYMDPANLFDAFLVAVIAWFIFRQSFVACILMILYWILSIIVTTAEGVGSFSILGLLFFYYYINGARGAWFLRQYREAKPRSRAKSILIWGLGCTVSLVFGLLVIMGTLMETGYLPDSTVVTGKDIPDTAKETMISNGLLEENEEIVLFYGAGLLSYLEDGNLLTDKRVISWWQEDEELQVIQIPYLNIEKAELTTPGDELTDSVIEVTTTSDDYFQLVVSVEDGGDIQFLKHLQDRILRVTSKSPIPLSALEAESR